MQFIELCILLGCDYLEPCKGIGPKTALKLLRDHNGLANVVSFVRSKMAEKAEESAHVIEEMDEEEIHSDRESEEGGGGVQYNSEGDEIAGPSSSPAKKKAAKSPAKKKKVTSSGMQIPEYWPWEEAKKLFEVPDVVKGDDLDVSANLMEKWSRADEDSLIGKRRIRMDWWSFCVVIRASSEF